MAEPTLSSPHRHLFLRRGKCAGLEPRSNHSSPTFPSATTSAPDGRRTGHLSTCCSQGKVQLPPLSGPIPSIDSCLKGRIPALKDPACFGYFDAFTIDSAHSRRPESCRQSAPNLCQNMAHLPGRGHRHSTWTRRRRQSHTKIYFDQAQFYAIPTPTREIVDLKTLFSRCTVIDVPMVGPNHYYFLQGKMASTPTFLFAGSTKPGRQSPETESRSTMVSNCARYLPVSVWMTKTKRRTKTATMRMKTARKGTKRMVMANVRFFSSFSDVPFWVEVASLAFTILCALVAKSDEYFSIPHCTQRPFLESNLRLTTTQGINGLTPGQPLSSVEEVWAPR
ncbi:BQ5605_C023g09761 [Microbotryum silenes-dioicae]|uniref:BQ5605_C023g09761 protein n=1 Tax=Microbotryum silenes-dioicae TaxID=796604 RepID=A0A2X0MQ96_9BASI|nr:BQ5605_C023g09761 [Microbotryum silenes-dioicae]